MTAEVRSYLERTIPARRVQQIVGDESALGDTVELLTHRFEITEADARAELSSFLAANGAGSHFVEIRTREVPAQTDDVDDALRSVDYQVAHGEARQRLIDNIVDYQIAMCHMAGDNNTATQDQRMQILRSAESLVDSIGVPTPEFLRGRDHKEDSDMVELRSRYLRALGDSNNGLTRVGLADSTGTNYGRWRPLRDRVISHLLQSNEIVRTGTEKRGRYYLEGKEPTDFVREDARVRQVYEAIHEEGPISRTALMSIVGNDSISGRDRVQVILNGLLADRFIVSNTNVRGYSTYAVQ
jgi:hypothetical protein